MTNAGRTTPSGHFESVAGVVLHVAGGRGSQIDEVHLLKTGADERRELAVLPDEDAAALGAPEGTLGTPDPE